MAAVELWGPAFLLGLMGAGHCLGMCGGIIAALSFAIPSSSSKKYWILGFYNVGRIVSYCVMGAIVGLFGKVLVATGMLHALRIFAGVLLILMGLYLADWWRVLTYLERWGQLFWSFLQPLGDKIMPVTTSPKAFLLGMVWGWLPCGLIYSTLAYAMASGSMSGGFSVMLLFGLGTLPAVFLGGILGESLNHWLRKKLLRRTAGLFVVLFGIYTVINSVGHHHHHEQNMPAKQNVPEAGLDDSPVMESDHEHHHHHH